MSTLSPSNPSPPPRKKSPWLIAGVFVLICLVGYLLFHCCRPCPPDLTPSALGFSTARTSGIDGLNHGDLNLPINEKIPVTIGLFGQDDSTLVKLDSAIAFKLELLDANHNTHPTLQLIQSTTGVLQAGNPTASLEIELRPIGREGMQRSAAPVNPQQSNSIFRRVKYEPKAGEQIFHLTCDGEEAIICASTYDLEVQSVCHGICPTISGPNTSTVHITVLGVFPRCGNSGNIGATVMPQEWSFNCTFADNGLDPSDIAPINPYANLTIPQSGSPIVLEPGSLKMEFDSNISVVSNISYLDYDFEFSVDAPSIQVPQKFRIKSEDSASRTIVNDHHIVHVINLCNP